MQFVMKNTGTVTNDRSLGVLGFLFQEDVSSTDIPFFNKINEFFPNTSHLEKSITVDLANFFDLYVPANSNFWMYEGSLTTPPCSEIINWYVNKNVIRINKKQLEKFKALWVTKNGYNPLSG